MTKLLILVVISISSILYSQKSYLIGDSQTSYIGMQSKKASIYNPLVKVGIGVKTLNKKFNYLKNDYCVSNVFICIGVNDSYVDGGIKSLVLNIKTKFPNAKIYVIQGSWGWGNVRHITGKSRQYVNYYNIFSKNNVIRLNHKIGSGDPHKNKKIYKLIGKEIDNLIK